MSRARERLARSAEEIDRRIGFATALRIHSFAEDPRGIDRRLRELDREWTLERALSLKSSTLSLIGLTLGMLRSRRWLLLSLLACGCALQHALGSRTPPALMLRRLGYRTAREIDIERSSLKALRGDFGPIGPGDADRDTRAILALQAALL